MVSLCSEEAGQQLEPLFKLKNVKDAVFWLNQTHKTMSLQLKENEYQRGGIQSCL